MEELDLLKKAWKKDTQNFNQVSENQIYKMLHKNSSSSVKWILIISVLEFVLWAGLNICFNTDDYFKKLHAEEILVYLKILGYINYAVILWFIYKFYTNYTKISTTASTKSLMQNIIRTRKTVHNYVWYNLGMMFFSMLIGYTIAIFYNPQFAQVANQKSSVPLIILICLLVVFSAVIIFLFWLFYRLLYGFLLKRLNNNYKELKKIDL